MCIVFSLFTTFLSFLTTDTHTHIYTYSAHTPDNSFMGFVSEELNETEKRSIQQNKVNSMAVVYGKEASMWKVVYTADTHADVHTYNHVHMHIFSYYTVYSRILVMHRCAYFTPACIHIKTSEKHTHAGKVFAVCCSVKLKMRLNSNCSYSSLFQC